MARDKTTPDRIDRKLKKLFDGDPSRLPVVKQKFAAYERPNIHLGLEEALAVDGIKSELHGVVIPAGYYEVGLAKLADPIEGKKIRTGAVEYQDVEIASGEQLAAVRNGLFLIREGKKSFALFVHEERFSHEGGIIVEVMAGSRDDAADFLRGLTRRIRYGRAFRGHVLSIEPDCFGRTNVRFHRLPRIDRDEIILSETTLNRLERHTIGFTRNLERLRAAGRHLKRGILLFGPPGTGKTLSAMYLTAQMAGRTVILVTGAGMGAIGTACKLARMLEPATVVLEDVDLIGTERGGQQVGANALLFELLNEMDGLADDADLLFILTTNRPDILEPALASRPGRIDQAIEIPLPDDECRKRLLDLYARGLTIEFSGIDDIIRRTEGASAAFIRELMRKAAVFAADNSEGELVVRQEHIEEALAELLVAGGQLTQSLLGAGISGDETEGTSG